MRLFPNSGTEPAPTCACAIKAKSSAKKCSWSRSVLECGGSAPLSPWAGSASNLPPSLKSAAGAGALQNRWRFERCGERAQGLATAGRGVCPSSPPRFHPARSGYRPSDQGCRLTESQCCFRGARRSLPQADKFPAQPSKSSRPE